MHVTAQHHVFFQQLGKILLGEPIGTPTFDHADSEPVWVRFLSQSFSDQPGWLPTIMVRWLCPLTMRSAEPRARGRSRFKDRAWSAYTLTTNSSSASTGFSSSLLNALAIADLNTFSIIFEIGLVEKRKIFNASSTGLFRIRSITCLTLVAGTPMLD